MPQMLELADAASRVKRGDTVAISGSVEMTPMALIRELVRSRVKELHLVCSGSAGMNADLLIGAGCVRAVEFSHIMLGESGLAPQFRKRAERGEIQTLEHTCPGLASAVTAGAMGLPFIPVQGLLGTGYLQVRPDFRVVPDPYRPDREIVVVPAIRPDVCLLHGYQADTRGNVVVSRTQNALQLVQASRISIVTVEEIVEPGRLDPGRGALLPASYISAVVEAPYGAHPAGCPGRYEPDTALIGQYAAAAKQDDTFQRFLHEFVDACGTHQQYIERYVNTGERVG